jgi:hypothetical protein
VTRVLHAAAAGRAVPGARGAIAAVLRWERNDSPHIIVRRLRRNDPVPPAYRALLLALWEARRMGARGVVLGIDDADVMTQLAEGGTPPPEAIGPYLQIRALLHAFRSAEVRHLTPGWDRDAALAADAAEHPGQPVCADLPLWACAAAS